MSVSAILNPMASLFSGAADSLFGGKKKLEDPEAQPKVPTLGDAKSQADYDQMKQKTYGRSGTIKNVGGSKGVASSLLNLSTPSLLGK